MASSLLPLALYIYGTSATNGGQSFAGLNLRTINYANSDNNSCKYIPYGLVQRRELTISLDLNKVLNSLPTAKDAPFNAYQQQHDLTCLRDTRVNLLREIHDQADGEDLLAIFQLSGLASTGKSTIAQTVAASYYAEGRLAASFFFLRAGGDVNYTRKFITSVAFQLAKAILALRPKICDAISKDKDIASQSLDNQWHELVLKPLLSLTGREG